MHAPQPNPPQTKPKLSLCMMVAKGLPLLFGELTVTQAVVAVSAPTINTSFTSRKLPARGQPFPFTTIIVVVIVVVVTSFATIAATVVIVIVVIITSFATIAAAAAVVVIIIIISLVASTLVAFCNDGFD
jgi:hypothetical protein